MAYVIKNNAGQYWTGSCWGVKQATMEYSATDETPKSLICDGDDAQMLKADSHDTEIYYYYDDAGWIEAKVVSE